MRADSVATVERAANGTCRVTASTMISASEYTSVLPSRGWASACSGEA